MSRGPEEEMDTLTQYVLYLYDLMKILGHFSLLVCLCVCLYV